MVDIKESDREEFAAFCTDPSPLHKESEELNNQNKELSREIENIQRDLSREQKSFYTKGIVVLLLLLVLLYMILTFSMTSRFNEVESNTQQKQLSEAEKEVLALEEMQKKLKAEKSYLLEQIEMLKNDHHHHQRRSMNSF